MSAVNDTLEEVSRAAFGLLLKEPFYAHVLAGMPREASGRTETAAVDWDGRQVRLIVNPDFFCGHLTAEERLAVLKHEVLHVVFHHLFRQGDRIPEIDNLAADLVVNQLVAPWPLPQGAVTLERFPDLALEPDQTVEYYYRRLLELSRETGQAGGHGGGRRNVIPGPAVYTALRVFLACFFYRSPHPRCNAVA
jgi:predicted metal-dependent peptidase